MWSIQIDHILCRCGAKWDLSAVAWKLAGAERSACPGNGRNGRAAAARRWSTAHSHEQSIFVLFCFKILTLFIPFYFITYRLRTEIKPKEESVVCICHDSAFGVWNWMKCGAQLIYDSDFRITYMHVRVACTDKGGVSILGVSRSWVCDAPLPPPPPPPPSSRWGRGYLDEYIP